MQQKKTLFLVAALLVLLVPMSGGCGTNLAYHTPTILDPATVARLKTGPFAKEVDIYVEISLVLTRPGERGRAKDYGALGSLISRGRALNDELLLLQRGLRSTLQASGANGDTKKLVELVQAENRFANALRRYLDVAVGYNRSWEEWNRSFLTEENEKLFNLLGQETKVSGESLARVLEEMSRERIELSPSQPPTEARQVQLDISGNDLENFPILVAEELKKRGISTTADPKAPRLLVRVTQFNKESTASRVGKWIVGLSIPNPGVIQTTSNAIELQVFLDENGKTTEFDEFNQFHESARDWEWLKRAVARRVAGALYFYSP